MNLDKLKILILTRLQNNNARTVTDHIRSFSKYSRHEIFTLSWVEPHVLEKINLNIFDAIVIHYSVVPFEPSHLSDQDCEKISNFKGIKIAFRQDEYQKVNQYYESLMNLGIHELFTCIPQDKVEELYPSFLFPTLILKNVLTGYIPEELPFLYQKNISERPITIGYRGRSCPYWYGDLAYDKTEIAENFLTYCKNKNINHDISNQEHDRLYNQDWLNFIGSCQCMLGTESGASLIDYTGEFESQWNQLTNSPYTALGVTQFTYKEYKSKYIDGVQEHDIFNQISPRIFEAIALGTVLILKRGKYSNILEPGKHYIEIKPDYSNLPDIFDIINDPEKLQIIADNAYQDIALNEFYSYSNFIKQFDCEIDKLSVNFNKNKVEFNHNDFNQLLKDIAYKNIEELLAGKGLTPVSFQVKKQETKNTLSQPSTETQPISIDNSRKFSKFVNYLKTLLHLEKI